MLSKRGLGGLKLSLGDSLTNFEDSMKDMGSTYRIEGMSLNQDQFRILGEELNMEVQYADLIIGKRIGQGACSSVHLAEHEVTGETYAVKMFNAFDKAQRSQMAKEVKLLTELDCDAIVGIKGAWYHEGRIGVIIEYMDRGSLEFLEDPSCKLTEQVISGIVFQIIWGLGYLHFDNRLHRDVKPANVLLNSQGQVKVSDFGISCALENTLNSGSSVGSYRYMSPERLLGERYNASADIWSVGVMLVQLWTKIYPFHYAASGPIELMAELETLDIDTYLSDLQFPVEFRRFIMCMLARKPSDRMDADQLLQHPWFASHGITDLPSAQTIVCSWLSEHDIAAARTAEAKKNNGNKAVRVDRASVRVHRSNLDGVLSDACEVDHALLHTPPLSRNNSTGSPKSSSGLNSVKTEMSDGSSSRNSSSGNLYARNGSRSNGPSPDALLENSLERLKSKLPAQRAAFARNAQPASLEHCLGDAISQRFGSMSLTGDQVSAKEASNMLSLTNVSQVAGSKRDRSLASTEASSVSLNTTTRTQSTANYTTGTGYSDLNLSIVDEGIVGEDEDDYLADDFDEAENSLDEVADEIVADYVDDDERLPNRPHLSRPISNIDAKESYYRMHK
jgi:serine/threonine protein kinase